MTKNHYRTESDSFGDIEVPSNCYWGAQTQRSIENFQIGDDTEKMPDALIKALAIVKRCAAITNVKLGKLNSEIGEVIKSVAEEIIEGKYDDQFPLVVWQTGSGTQTNMNLNEVISNIAIQKLGGVIGSKKPVHPNDHVNMSQSSNDSFPTAMHIATLIETNNHLLPALEHLKNALAEKAEEFSKIIKIGRTHMQDATPMTLGNEFSGYAAQISFGIERVIEGLKRVKYLAQGGTAVGTGINSPKNFGEVFSKEVSVFIGIDCETAPNKFEALASNDAMVEFSGSLNVLAVSINKIANDIRMLASGPMCGIGEIILPENEPGSSIMPGKVNPTQCEAITMVCAEVMGNNATITFAGAQGHFELNVFKPVIIYNVLRSIALLSTSIVSFTNMCVLDITANHTRIKELQQKSLMFVTALVPHIGYDNAAQIAQKALSENITLKEAGVILNLVTEQQYDEWVIIENMINPQ